MHIERLDTDTKARDLATLKGSAEAAELSLSKVTNGLVIADHTHVSNSMRGQRIVPPCPFVRAHAAKRRDKLADVVQW